MNDMYAQGTQPWISSTPNLLVYTPYAAKRQMNMIGWLRDDYPENRKEQGGWLIGRYVRDGSGRPIQAEVIDVLQAKAGCRSTGYIEWSAWEELRMQQEFFSRKEELARTDPARAEELAVIGWWHTHPNELPVFMSHIDMETQRLKYFKPEKYAVVLNPHKGIFRAYVGKQADEVAAVMLLQEDSGNMVENIRPDVIKHTPCDSNLRKQNRHKKRCKSKRKKKKGR